MAQDTTIRFSTFPRTEAPPDFIETVLDVFRQNEGDVATTHRDKGLTSDEVLVVLRDDLTELGFDVEAGKRADQKIKRPVFFGENARPSLQYEIDAFHRSWRAGLEIEAGRAWMGNAVYRDLIQALVMVNLEHLLLAVPNVYRFKTSGRNVASKDYSNTVSMADALYGHSRITMPFTLTVIGY